MHERYRSGDALIALLCFASPLALESCTTQDVPSTEEPSSSADSKSAPTYTYKVFAMNRRGMAFPDTDFQVSAIFPPANFLVAQVVSMSSNPNTNPRVLDDTEVTVRYSAVMDAAGSINSTSGTKTNFWKYADELYEFTIATPFQADEGVHGAASESQWMPGFDNRPQNFTRYDSATSTFTAPFVPIVPMDDLGNNNHFPLFKIEAIDRTGVLLASTVIPLPMAEPMRCETCHATGGIAADALTSRRLGGLAWSDDTDDANNAKKNIAIAHTPIAGIDLTIRQPYLCAECHYSPIADPDNRGPFGDYQTHRNHLSISIHAWHSLDRQQAPPVDNATALIPEDGETSCKICHGGEQPYTRGPMRQQGIVCQDCHGGLMAVGKSPLVGASATRTPFADEPRCESCHTGDEVSHLGDSVVLRKAFDATDSFATPRLATNRRFAETPATLYRTSRGHGGMTCISCHGSPHAEWPVMSDDTHDNDIATQLQGHAGRIVECSACHAAGLPPSMSGPHGLHNVDDPNFVLDHGGFFAAGNNREVCQACHGVDLNGGRLSRAAAPRRFKLPDGRTMAYAKDQPVGCADCHAMP